MAEIILSNGMVASVDEKDLPLLSDHSWHASPNSWTTYAMARRIPFDSAHPNAMVKMHRLILGAPKGVQVDHRNGNGLDNRRENLRLATPSQNAANTRQRRGRSRFKGVYLRAGGHWRAVIRFHGKGQYLGAFVSETEAALAYNAAAIRLFGEFARLNVIPQQIAPNV
jgi:hypothetical protein